MSNDVYAHRAMLLPWDCTFNPKDQTLIGDGTGDGTGDTIPYEYPAFGAVGDLIWLIPTPGLRRITGPDVDPKGYDERFNGLYLVEDLGHNGTFRNWKLRRAICLDTTEKYRETSTIWFLSDSENPKPAWSPLGKPFHVFLPLFFQLNVSTGPMLNAVDLMGPSLPM